LSTFDNYTTEQNSVDDQLNINNPPITFPDFDPYTTNYTTQTSTLSDFDPSDFLPDFVAPDENIHATDQIPLIPSSSTTEYRQPSESEFQQLVGLLSMPPPSSTTSDLAPSQPLRLVEHERQGPSHLNPSSFQQQSPLVLMQPIQTADPPGYGFSTIQFLDPLARFEGPSSPLPSDHPLSTLSSSSSSTAAPTTPPLQATKRKGNNPKGLKGVTKCQRCQDHHSVCRENPENAEGPCLRCLRGRGGPLECIRKSASERERKGRKRRKLERSIFE